MANLSEYTDYKKILVKAIINDRECVNIISNKTTLELPAKSLIETSEKTNQIHLYDYIPGTKNDGITHVCIDVDDGPTITNNVAGFYVCIDVIVPEALMVMNGQIRRDALAEAIDRLINGSQEYGFGEVKRVQGARGVPMDGYRGRELRYYVKGWNMARMVQ